MRQPAGQRRQQRPIGPVRQGPSNLTPEHRDLHFRLSEFAVSASDAASGYLAAVHG